MQDNQSISGDFLESLREDAKKANMNISQFIGHIYYVWKTRNNRNRWFSSQMFNIYMLIVLAIICLVILMRV